MASNGTIINRFDINTYYEDQLLSDLAFDRQNYLVAWSDRRNGPDQVFYTLVTQDGNVLNDSSILLSKNDSCDYSTLPAVAANQYQFFVAWLGLRISGNIVLGSRINNSGEIIDTIPLSLSSDTLLLERVAISSDGQNYLVVWSGETPGAICYDLYGRRINTDGEILDTVPFLIAQSPQGLSEPAVTFGSGYYFVVWSGMNEEQNIYGCRISADGSILDPGGFPICTDTCAQWDPAITTDGERFLVTWADFRSGNYDIYASLVDTNGNVGIETQLRREKINRLKIEVSPTPTRSTTVIKFFLKSEEKVHLAIYDARGSLVQTLISDKLSIGEHQMIWDGSDYKGHLVKSGCYFCQFQTKTSATSKRIIRLK